VRFVPEFNSRLLLPTLLAVALGGCSSISEVSLGDFNPLKKADPIRSEDYNYFYRSGAVNAGPATAADLVGPDGRCGASPTFAPGPAPVTAEPIAQAPASAPINPRSNQALYFTAGPETGRPSAAIAPSQLPPQVRTGPTGIALQMTECQVVAVAGYTDRVEISGGPGGQRLVTLTYLSGERPGIYRFVNGRLNAMERVEAPAQPKKPTRTAKKPAR